MNIGTGVVLLALIVLVALIVGKMIRDKKEGRTCGGCKCSSSGCTGSGSCHTHSTSE